MRVVLMMTLTATLLLFSWTAFAQSPQSQAEPQQRFYNFEDMKSGENVYYPRRELVGCYSLPRGRLFEVQRASFLSKIQGDPRLP